MKGPHKGVLLEFISLSVQMLPSPSCFPLLVAAAVMVATVMAVTGEPPAMFG